MTEGDVPLGHVLRHGLPWRPGERLTECGRVVDGDVSLLTHEAFVALVKRLGKQRSAMLTCMTCWGTALRWQATWAQSPSTVLNRYTHGRDLEQLDIELRALAALAERHPEEFEALCHPDELQQRRRAQGGR